MPVFLTEWIESESGSHLAGPYITASSLVDAQAIARTLSMEDDGGSVTVIGELMDSIPYDVDAVAARAYQEEVKAEVAKLLRRKDKEIR